MIPSLSLPGSGRVLGLLRPALLALLLWSCDGANGWRDLPTSPGQRADRAAPEVEIRYPTSSVRVAARDSVRVDFRVADDVALDSIVISGYALRGSAALGTQTSVPRFATKVIRLRDVGYPVRDTTLTRYLLATGDSVPEQNVYVAVAAFDSTGKSQVARTAIAIGGPRVEIPAAPSAVRAGTRLRVRVLASDTVGRISVLRLTLRTPAGGTLARDSVVLSPAQARADTVFELAVPTGVALGDAQLVASVRGGSGERAEGNPLPIRVLAAAADQLPPVVTFSSSVRSRAEPGDTLSVSVSATDSTEVARVGVTIQAVQYRGASTVSLPARSTTLPGRSGDFRFRLADLGVTGALDTATVRLEITAFAYDTTGNCGAATQPRSPSSAPCDEARQAGIVLSQVGSPRPVDVLIVGSHTVRPASPGRLVDLVADTLYQRVLVSNQSLNQVEVLPVGGRAFGQPFRVGSLPWGLAIGRGGDTLFVANSGGTNISVVPLAPALRETGRIRVPDIQLYSFTYDVEKDSVKTATINEYSDRPQFIGQISGGQILYSTQPTSAREPGTVRIFDTARDTSNEFGRASEIFVRYATAAAGKGIVVNALDAGVSQNQMLTVCPRRLRRDQSDPPCLSRTARRMAQALDSLRAQGLSDTRVELSLDIASVALTDTTFVAVSGDNSTIAFGEGGVDPGRVFLFQTRGGTLYSSTTGTADLVSNAAERVISLSLNQDGSLGAARGRRTYFFEDDLRLQGVVDTGTPSGGISLHPDNRNYPAVDVAPYDRRRGFVSGVSAGGVPYLDVVDTFNFRTVRRVVVRDTITGAVIAVPVASGDPAFGRLALRIFAITPSGVLQLEFTPADLE